ncbi:MAG: ExeA family protein, partial [Deltaproteobacteria bacterium]
LRMLASLAEGEEPLARLILAGQTPLEERLAEPALEALNQRIVCHVCLEPLTRRQSVDYVNFRIAWAGGDTAQIFAPQALERIASACNGLPRCLNQLCDHVLLLTCVQELPRVTDDAVREALRDLQQLPLHWNAPVAADTPLDGLGDGPVSSEAAPDNDEIEFAPIVANDVSSAPERGETVCFEIGASEAETGPTTPSIDRFGHPQPSPVSSGRAGRRSFAEEIIDDRYAALDVRSPRVRRTFEDCAVPEDWRSPRQTPVCTAPLPPAPPAGSQPGENRPAEMPGNQFPVQNDAGENVVPPGGSNGDVPEYVSFANLDEGSRLTFDGVEPERQPIEEQLGCSVLDACLEVQAAIGHWHAADGTINSIDHGHGSAIDAGDVIVPAPSNEYDVIEPDSQTTAADVDDAASDAGEIDSRSAGHYVPQPKYRHVFSTLRRRLGRPLIRKG